MRESRFGSICPAGRFDRCAPAPPQPMGNAAPCVKLWRLRNPRQADKAFEKNRWDLAARNTAQKGEAGHRKRLPVRSGPVTAALGR